MRIAWPVLLAAVLFGAASGMATPANEPAALGERIYRAGSLPDGAQLVGERDSGANVAGDAAACVNCHRRSGLGNVEGDIVIPPIIAKYLYRSRRSNSEDLTLPHVPGLMPNAFTYTDATLAKAIRTGIRPNGEQMNSLMPHYALDEPSMTALIARCW